MRKRTHVELPPDLLHKEFHYHVTNPKAGIGELGCGFYPRSERVAYQVSVGHGYFGLIYLLRGGGRVSHGHGRSRRVRAGDIIQLPSGCQATVTPDQPDTWFEAFLSIDSRFILRMATLFGIDLMAPVRHLGLDLFLIRRFRQITAELAFCSPKSLQITLLHAAELVVAIHQMDRGGGNASGEESLIARACGLLQVSLDRRIDLQRVASELGVGYHHFRFLFKKHFGLSPGQYRIHCRLQRARVMLRHEGKTVKQVAEALGYADQFVFSKQFKKFIGRAPSRVLAP